MATIELVLLIIAYTLIVVTIFLEIICYRRNLETPETIAFTFSLLLLIIAFTVSSFLENSKLENSINIFTLIAMILVGLTTPLNVLEERQHDVNPIWKKVLFTLSILLVVIVVVGFFTNFLEYLQYAVILFLSGSVILSMLLVRLTKPQKRVAHRERIERLFAIGFIVLVPLSLFANYLFKVGDDSLKIGFTLPLIFILLSGSKFLDDLERLSLINPTLKVKDQNLKNYLLSDREKEIALLLTSGKTYQHISDELYISMATVKSHASNIYKKCGVKTRSELTILLIN